jgi:dTDP-4-amino-4,6-dideoxygalactose transaminase
LGRKIELFEPKTIVITGAAGFIGAHLVQCVLHTYPHCRIKAVDSLTYAGDMKRLEKAIAGGRVDWVHACILDQSAMLAACRGADAVFHLAAESYVGKSFLEEEIFYKTNVEGTRCVLFSALVNGVQRVVHFSTDEVYGSCNFAADEKTAFAPTSPYAKSKVEAESEVIRFRAEGLDIRVLRPSNVVGTGQHIEKVIPKFITACLSGQPFTLEGSGLQKRTFLPVSDLCNAATMVLERGARNATFNVCGRETKTIMEVAEMIVATCGSTCEVVQIADRPINDLCYSLNGDRLAELGWIVQGTMQAEIDKEVAIRRSTILVDQIPRDFANQNSLVPTDNDFEYFPVPIAFHRPYRATQEKAFVDKVMNSGSFAGGGARTNEAELLLAQLTGAQQVRLTHSCTAALEIAALAIDLSQGDEVIVPAFTFCATATAFVAAGAKIVFCDVDRTTLMINVQDFVRKITPKTRAVAVVHYGGGLAEMAQLAAICTMHKIEIIEDAAQAIGVRFGDKHAGSFGTFGALSFHETKVLQCGNGGALLINSSDPALLSRVDTILNRGTDFEKMRRGEQAYYQWDGHGSSYRPSEFQAALIQAQLLDLSKVLEKRQKLATRYHLRLDGIDGPLSLLKAGRDIVSNNHCVVLVTLSEAVADDLLAYLQANNIRAQRHYAPLNSSNESIRRGELCSCPQTEAVWRCIVRLPIHTEMGERDVDFVCQKIVGWLSFNQRTAVVSQTIELA